jgi:hypothetical protein
MNAESDLESGSMLRQLKKLIGPLLTTLMVSNASAFSIWGPAETWQTQDLDYGIRYLPFYGVAEASIFDVLGPGDLAGADYVELGGTKNIGEGSRQNTPIITYAYDTTFLNYFGAQGVAAVDAAFNVFNGLPPASSANLVQFLTQGNQQINYTAQALRMLDLKSTVMWLLIEHLGLIGETHAYDLRYRVAVPTAGASPCDFDYVVLQRNFDPVTYDVSPYVNGTLYSYQIAGLCPAVAVSDAMEYAANSGAAPFSAVATREGLQVGGYYLGITRDDMGGLSYLYREDRYVNEGVDANVTVSSTSTSYWTSPPSTNAAAGTGGTIGAALFAGLLGGVEKVTFVKTAYDSQLGTTFKPITYHYTLPWVTNGQLKTLKVTRVITAPDIIFTAGDMVFPGPDEYEVAVARNGPTANFITYGAAASPGLPVDANIVTPSVITPELVVTFNNAGPIFYNEGTGYNSIDTSVELGFVWGSFDGSTNPPVAFPTGTTLEEIEGEVLSAGAETLLSPFNPVSVITNTATTGAGVGVTP